MLTLSMGCAPDERLTNIQIRPMSNWSQKKAIANRRAASGCFALRIGRERVGRISLIDNPPLAVDIYRDIYHDKDRQTLPQWPQPGRPPAFRIPFRRLGSLRAPRLRDRRRHPVSAPESWQDLFELMNMIEVPRDLLADRKDAHPQKRELF